DLPHAGVPVVEGLRDRGVRLVTAGRTHAFVLVVDARRRLKRLLESSRAKERSRTPLLVDVEHRLRNLDFAFGGHLLHDERHREEGCEIVRSHRLQRAGLEQRRRRDGQIGEQVVPVLRNARFVEDVFDRVAHMEPLIYFPPIENARRTFPGIPFEAYPDPTKRTPPTIAGPGPFSDPPRAGTSLTVL